MIDYQGLAFPVLAIVTALAALLTGWLARGLWEARKWRRLVSRYAAPLRDRDDEPTGIG